MIRKNQWKTTLIVIIIKQKLVYLSMIKLIKQLFRKHKTDNKEVIKFRFTGRSINIELIGQSNCEGSHITYIESASSTNAQIGAIYVLGK